MPITVKHGPEDLSALAAVALLSGMGRPQVPQLPNITARGAQIPGGGGGGGIRHGRPLGRTPLSREPSYREKVAIQTQAELERSKQEAKQNADLFEQKFTAKQRQGQAEAANAHREIDNSQYLSPEEKMSAHKNVDLVHSADFQPTTVPRDENKPPPEEIERMRTPFIDEASGGLMGYDRNGAPRVLVPPDKLPAAIQMQAQVEAEKRRQEFEDKLWTTTKKNQLTGEETFISPDEVQKRLEERYGQKEKGPATPWWELAEKEGMPVKEQDKRLPDQVGYASAYLRQMKQKFGSFDKIPQDLRPAVQEAAAIVRKWGEVQSGGMKQQQIKAPPGTWGQFVPTEERAGLMPEFPLSY